MPDLYPLQESFAHGAISPRLFTRPSSDRYQQGLAWCENFIPFSHGPLRRRAGTRFVAQLDEEDPNLTMIPVELTPLAAGVLVIGRDNVTLYDGRGIVTHTADDLELIQNGQFDANRVAWQRITEHATASVQWDRDFRAMQLHSGGTQEGRFAAAQQTVNLLDTTGVSHTVRYDIAILRENDDADIRRLGRCFIYKIDGTLYAEKDLENGTDQSLTFTPEAGQSAIVVRFSVRGGGIVNVENVSLKKDNAARLPARWTSPYSAYDRLAIQWASPPGATSVWLAHPNVPPYRLRFDGTDTYEFDLIPFTNPPSYWNGTSWPAAITFHQQRSWWGGAPQAPETLNASVTASYRDLDTSLPAEATNGMQYTLAERGPIAWMKGARTLVIGTQRDEWIAESEGNALIPGDIEFRKQSSYGSLIGQVEDIGDRVIYASGDETKLRTMAYEWTRDAWVSIDLAWPSEHLTQNKLERVVYMKEPESVLIATEAGSPYRLLVCMYNREQNIIGWADLVTEGLYRGVATTPFQGITVPWVVTQRELSGDRTVFYLERFWAPYHVDCHVERAYDEPTTTFDGLEALDGIDCTVIIRNGAELSTHPNVQPRNGTVELQWPARHAIFGFGYKARALTLPLMAGQQASNTAGRFVRWNRIYARVLDSAFPRLENVPFMESYRALRNGEAIVSQRPFERQPVTPMDTREPGIHEDVQVMGAGWDLASGVYIEQDLPVYTEIAGIFGEAGLGRVDE